MKKNWLIFVNLLFTMVGIFVFYKIPYKLYDKYNDTRLDPIQISNIKIDSTKYYNYVFFGRFTLSILVNIDSQCL
jgi:hypothetical protein